MRRAIVTGCNLGFLPGAAGLLRSVREFHPDVARYCLVPPNEAESCRAGLGDLAEVVTAPRPVRGVPDKPLLQLLAARTFIPTFPADVVAWVDCDVVFCRAAPELWDVPPGMVNAVVPGDDLLAHALAYAQDLVTYSSPASMAVMKKQVWDDLDKLGIPTEAEAKRAVDAIDAQRFKIGSVESKPVKRHPAPPFITSTLQQEASRKLGFAANSCRVFCSPN